MAIIVSSQAIQSNIALPLNLPLKFARKAGQPYSDCIPRSQCNVSLEDQVLIDRIADIDQGDQGYRLRYQTRQLDLYHELQIQYNLTRLSGQKRAPLPKFDDFADIPDTQAISAVQTAYPDPPTLMSVIPPLLRISGDP